MNKDNLMGISQRELTKLDQIEASNEKLYEYIMQCSNNVAIKTREILSEMINRGLVYSFERNLPPNISLENAIAKTLAPDLISRKKL
jgi:hypothetical protein